MKEKASLLFHAVTKNSRCSLAATFCGFILHLIGRETINILFPLVFARICNFSLLIETAKGRSFFACQHEITVETLRRLVVL